MVYKEMSLKMEELEEFTFPLNAAVYPGGSGIPVDFGFDIGGALRSMTHWGGVGVGTEAADMLEEVAGLAWCRRG